MGAAVAYEDVCPYVEPGVVQKKIGDAPGIFQFFRGSYIRQIRCLEP